MKASLAIRRNKVLQNLLKSVIYNKRKYVKFCLYLLRQCNAYIYIVYIVSRAEMKQHFQILV